MQFSKSEAETAAALERLGLTPEEIEQTILDDRQINQGAKLFELTDEQKAASKKARATGTRKATQTTRKRKEDEDKRELITMIFDLFRDTCIDDEPITEINVTNPERQIDFNFHNRKFRIVLSAPRT
jgi:hypothetical protein